MNKANKVDIKIFTSYHKKCELFENDYIYPIQVGTDVSGEVYPDTLHDNTGDNISAKNGMYCELTAQYWAWKNANADYYGFMHYRRYFIFNPAPLKEDPFGNVLFPRLNGEVVNEVCLDKSTIERVVQRYDVVCTEPQPLKNLNQGKTVWEHYKNSPHHRIKDLKTILDIIDEKYPDYIAAAHKYIKSTIGYFCNMYILKKEIFEAYSAWLFDILEEHEKRTDFSDYTVDEYRVSGFLAERLWGIYLTWLKDNKQDLKIKELQRTFFQNTDENSEINPAFEGNAVPIVLAASDNYIPYVAVTLRSIIANANPAFNYDIVILNSDITEESKTSLVREFSENSHVSIRFFNVAHILSNRELYVHRHFTVEIYYRLLMQDIIHGYDKVIYLDSDLVVLDDISRLYQVDIGDSYVAAVEDVDFAGCYKGADSERKVYFDKVLKMKSPYHYFNSGVLIMNLEQLRKNLTSMEIFDLVEQRAWLFPDQDVLNVLCENHVYYLNPAWNVMMDWRDGQACRLDTARKAPHVMYQKYLKARKEVKIAHFAGFQKPWVVPDCDFAEFFWKYSRQTSFYEQLLYRCSTRPVPGQGVSATVKLDNPFQLKIPGMKETLYIDGVYVKLLNRLNRMFPLGSKRRSIVRNIAKFFFR